MNFGTIQYWIDKWNELHDKYKPGDSLTRLQMREAAQKIVDKKKKEDKQKKSD